MISKVWKKKQSKKIFLDIIYGTQLRKCKQLRVPFMKKITQLVDNNTPDKEIFEQMRQFIHEETAPNVRKYIQHQGHYRGINRCTKLNTFIREYKKNPSKLETILDIGCGDGSITKTVSDNLKVPKTSVHGCDIVKPLPKNLNFTFSLIESPGKLPYDSKKFDVVYALMSLHHITEIDSMLSEVYRVLKDDGIFIVREHDCVSEDLSNVLDLVHGFYSMVWCSPQEMESFEDEYFANYFTANKLDELVGKHTFQRVFGTNRDEEYPLFHQGKVINPLKHYWVVYVKNNISNKGTK